MAIDWGNLGQGALGGAGSGAALGSAFPGIGTAVGAVGGGVLGGLGSLFGQSDEFKQLPTQNPQQQQALSQLLGNLQQQGGPGGNYQKAQDYLGQLLSRDPQAYDRFAAPYLQQFQSQIIPMIAERFATQGGGMGGASSGFSQQLGQAGAGLQSNLAGLFANLQQNAAGQATNQYNQLANQGLGTNPFENLFIRGNTGVGGAVAGGLAQGLGQYGGSSLMQQLVSHLSGMNQNKATGTDVQTQ